MKYSEIEGKSRREPQVWSEMRSHMPVFAKKESCPTSVELSAVAAGEKRLTDVPRLRWHLTFCDFCAAEFEIYLRFPPLDEAETDPPSIPKHLRDLAISLLNGAESELIDHFGNNDRPN